MKLITFIYNGEEQIGVLNSAGHAVPAKCCGVDYSCMNELIVKASRSELKALNETAETSEGISLSDVELLAPVPYPLQDILCLGLNYTEHAAEAAEYSKEAFTSEKQNAIYFSKRVNVALAHMGTLPDCSAVTERLDYEVELAVILGRDAKNVRPEDVKDYIFGYTIVNDMSARDLQTRHKQWYFGKSLDGFSPMGPCIVTADEISYPPRLAISSTVNGQLRQNGNTGMFIHDIDEIVSELSAGMTLRAGTIIATGTPKGVAMGMEKPDFLKKGDVITCTIEKIGDLTTIIG